MTLHRLLTSVLFVFISAPLFAQSIDIGNLSDAKFSDGYKKSMIIDLQGTMQDKSGNSVPATVYSATTPGVIVEKSGKRLLKIDQNMIMTAGPEAVTLQLSYYVDPLTLLDVYSEHPDGEETHYSDVRDYPKSISIGEKVLLKNGRTINNKKPNTVLEKSVTYLELFPSKAKVGMYDLCETDVDYDRKSGFKAPSTVTSTCNLINDKGDLLGYSLMSKDNDTLMYLTGTLIAQ